MQTNELFSEFLKTGKAAVIDGTKFIMDTDGAFSVWDKGATIYPVYIGYSYNTYKGVAQADIPSQLELVGFWVPDVNTYLQIGPYSRQYMENAGVKFKTETLMQRTIRKEVVEKVAQWRADNFDAIEPAERYQPDVVAEKFKQGYLTIDLGQTKKQMESALEKKVEDKSFDLLLYITGNTAEVDGYIQEEIESETNKIAITKANRRELQKRVEGAADKDTAGGRTRAVKTALLEVQQMGLVNCNVTFDFGYASVTQKVNAMLPYNWINNTQVATDTFEENFLQPVTMHRYGCNLQDAFLAYVTSIVVRAREIYHAEPLENRPENQLYNVIVSGKRDFKAEKFEKMDLDCSIPTADGSDILSVYVKNYDSTLDGAKFLISRGASPKLAYDYMTEENNSNCRKPFRRNWDEIYSYLETLL